MAGYQTAVDVAAYLMSERRVKIVQRAAPADGICQTADLSRYAGTVFLLHHNSRDAAMNLDIRDVGIWQTFVIEVPSSAAVQGGVKLSGLRSPISGCAT